MSAFARRYADVPEDERCGLLCLRLNISPNSAVRGGSVLVWSCPTIVRPPMSAQTDVVLRNLLVSASDRIHTEGALALIAKNYPEKVSTSLGERLVFAASRGDEEDYEEIPFRSFVLNQCFANVARPCCRTRQNQGRTATARRWSIGTITLAMIRGRVCNAPSPPARRAKAPS